jgi:hypothetical protein
MARALRLREPSGNMPQAMDGAGKEFQSNLYYRLRESGFWVKEGGGNHGHHHEESFLLPLEIAKEISSPIELQLIRACFINSCPVLFAIPQGLKPLVFRAIFGTTEVVP